MTIYVIVNRHSSIVNLIFYFLLTINTIPYFDIRLRSCSFRYILRNRIDLGVISTNSSI